MTKRTPSQEAGTHGLSLASEATRWSTPSASSYGTDQGGGMGRTGPVRPSLETMARTSGLPDQWTPKAGSDSSCGTPKLNQRFVCALMGLPTDWTDAPGFFGQTNSGRLETESCPPSSPKRCEDSQGEGGDE